MATPSSIERLNSFLRGEIAAVETYQLALTKQHISAARDELLMNLKSHQDRVMMLQDAIEALGGQPVSGAGPWGTFAKAIEAGTKPLGAKVAIAALEEAEDDGVRDYESELDHLDLVSRRIVLNDLLPAQHRTHDRLIALKHRI